jgi:hypothetical protein
VGARFDLGKINTVNAITKLVGGVAGPSLQIDNNSTNASATALDLQVEPGKAPMKVNSATQVANLNSDLFDGKDSQEFLPAATYANLTGGYGTSIGRLSQLSAFCDSGDRIISGGHREMDPGTTFSGSFPWLGAGTIKQGWTVEWENDGTADYMSVTAFCADFPPLRP